MNGRTVLHYLTAVSLAAAVVAAVILWGGPLAEFLGDREKVGRWLEGFGAWAPLVSIGVNALQVVLAPVPGHVIGLANGYLFGILMGTVYSMAGLVIGSAVAMLLGRAFGRPLVVRLVGSDNIEKLDRMAHRRGHIFFFLVFLLPMLPDDLACFAVGLSPLSIPFILLLAAIGRLPGMVVSSWIGAEAGSMGTTGQVLLLGGAMLLGVLAIVFRKRVEAALLGLARMIDRRKRSA